MLASLWSLSAALLLAAPSGATLRVSVSEPANLTYQLDCLSGVTVSCARGPFEALWKHLGWTAADDEALRRWKEIRARYNPSVMIRPRPEAGFPFDGRGIGWGEKLRIAELSADDDAELERNLRLLVSEDDASGLLQLYQRFEPRFHGWWAAEGGSALPAFRRSLQAIIAEAQLGTFADQVAELYGAPRGATFTMHLIALPVRKGPTHGEEIENHAAIEVPRGEDPRDRIDVILHEIFHTLFRYADARREGLERTFAASPDPDALAAWGLLDEALATALGNALVAEKVHSPSVARRLKTAGGLYNDPFIDPMAKALLPVIEKRLAAHAPLDAAFVTGYLALAHRTLGKRLGAPALVLRTMALVYDQDALEPATDALLEGVHARSSLGSSPVDAPDAQDALKQYPKLPAAILVTRSRLGALSGWGGLLGADVLGRLQARAAREPSFVEAIHRSSGAPVWIFVAPDAGQMTPLVQHFAAASEN